MVFNEDKTRIAHRDDGCDFLGFNVRRYRNGKLLIKPSSAAVKRLRSRLADEMRALRGSNAAAVTDVTLGTTKPTLSFGIPGNDQVVSSHPGHLNFYNGIVVAATAPVEGATAPSATIPLNLGFR